MKGQVSQLNAHIFQTKEVLFSLRRATDAAALSFIPSSGIIAYSGKHFVPFVVI